MKSIPEIQSLLAQHIATLRQEQFQTGELYQPMDYILALGGKRIRPLLFLLAYQAVEGKDVTQALDAACSVELFHNFSLLHDDIMDNAPLRRGQPTVHEKWDVNTAILAGDAMFALSFEVLVRDFPIAAAKLVKEFARVSVGVCEGQMEDMLMAARPSATIPEYIEMIRKKTAMLIGGSLSLGALAAGASDELAAKFYAYGEAAGIGFQLHDDYLDVFAGAGKSGKQVAGDILENKKTYLLLRALEKAGESRRPQLEAWLDWTGAADEKVAAVTQLYVELGIPQETLAHMELYFAQASLAGQDLAQLPGFVQIQHFMDLLKQRDH
jgi:geranylgeranyl diphosphate synthase type II